MNERHDYMEAIENGSDTDSAQGMINENVELALLNERHDYMEGKQNSSDTDSANGTIKPYCFFKS